VHGPTFDSAAAATTPATDAPPVADDTGDTVAAMSPTTHPLAARAAAATTPPTDAPPVANQHPTPKHEPTVDALSPPMTPLHEARAVGRPVTAEPLTPKHDHPTFGVLAPREQPLPTLDTSPLFSSAALYGTSQQPAATPSVGTPAPYHRWMER
jgi:hypothetical protein